MPLKRGHPSVPIDIYTVPEPGKPMPVVFSGERSSGDILYFFDDEKQIQMHARGGGI